MLRHLLLVLSSAATIFVAAGVASSKPNPKPLTVFAAASLKNVFDAAAMRFERDTSRKVRASYAGSLTLARQIEQGAPADVFCAADQETMDYAASRSLIRKQTRRPVLSNRIVVVAHRSAAFATLSLTPSALAEALGSGRLSMGDPASVPAGKYARAALERLNLWGALQGRLAYSENVRAAMLFVSRNEAPLGVVYATDAAAEPQVKIVARIPDDVHPPIVYPCAAVTNGEAEGADEFLSFLRTSAAREIFEKAGFASAP